MFEQTIENIKGSIVLEQNYKNILDQCGFIFDFQVGYNTFTCPEDTVPGVPKYLKKRFVSVITQIIFAFGPEFESRHYRKII